MIPTSEYKQCKNYNTILISTLEYQQLSNNSWVATSCTSKLHFGWRGCVIHICHNIQEIADGTATFFYVYSGYCQLHKIFSPNSILNLFCTLLLSLWHISRFHVFSFKYILIPTHSHTLKKDEPTPQKSMSDPEFRITFSLENQINGINKNCLITKCNDSS